MCMHLFQFAPTKLSLNTTALTPRWQITSVQQVSYMALHGRTGCSHLDHVCSPGAATIRPAQLQSSSTELQGSTAGAAVWDSPTPCTPPPLPPSLPGCPCSCDDWTGEFIRILHLKAAHEWNYEQQASDQYLIPHDFRVQFSVSSEQGTMCAANLLPHHPTCTGNQGDRTQNTKNFAIFIWSNTPALQAQHHP